MWGFPGHRNVWLGFIGLLIIYLVGGYYTLGLWRSVGGGTLIARSWSVVVWSFMLVSPPFGSVLSSQHFLMFQEGFS